MGLHPEQQLKQKGLGVWLKCLPGQMENMIANPNSTKNKINR
jgi:hypothetical protein